jgi:hypothetical protein
MLSDEYIQKVEPQTQRTVLLEASVTPAGNDPTAEVCRGELVLFGPVIAACLEWPTDAEEERQYYYAGNDTALIRFAPDYDLSAPGPGNVAVGSAVYLLFLCREPELKKSNVRSAKTKVFALVLRRVDESIRGNSNISSSSSSQRTLGSDVVEVPGDGTYERIGIYIDALEGVDSEHHIEENGVDCVVKLI